MRPEGRTGCEDNIGLYAFQCVVVQAELFQSGDGQIRNHHICRFDQPAHNLAPVIGARLERHPPLVPPNLNVVGALPLLADRHGIPVFSASGTLNANHVRAEISQQRASKWPSYIAAKINNTNSFKHLAIIIHE